MGDRRAERCEKLSTITEQHVACLLVLSPVRRNRDTIVPNGLFALNRRTSCLFDLAHTVRSVGFIYLHLQTDNR